MNEMLLHQREIFTQMSGARLQAISLGISAIALEFAKQNQSETLLYRLKTASFVFEDAPKNQVYEEVIRGTLPGLYASLEATLTSIEFDGSRSILVFSNGATFTIKDVEGLWDHTFAIERISIAERQDFLF
ncbi:MAG: hypothetical protein AAF296_09275 [Pseudomonadota bacterium]